MTAKIEQMTAIARNYDVAERDDRNRALGRAGEERVLTHERASLLAAGRTDLAERIRSVSHVDGDGAGYDILSFDPDGSDRLIEVKTTNGRERTPFHITRNELAIAEAQRSDWRLVRLWNFAREPKAFELRPPLEAQVSLMTTAIWRTSCSGPSAECSVWSGSTMKCSRFARLATEQYAMLQRLAAARSIQSEPYL